MLSKTVIITFAKVSQWEEYKTLLCKTVLITFREMKEEEGDTPIQLLPQLLSCASVLSEVKSSPRMIQSWPSGAVQILVLLSYCTKH